MKREILISCVAVCAVFLLSEVLAGMSLEARSINSLTINDLNNKVRVKARIVDVRDYKSNVTGLTLVDVENPDKRIKAVIFESVRGLEKDMCMDVVADVKKYKGALELVASSFRSIGC